jgi:hypothetical protein
MKFVDEEPTGTPVDLPVTFDDMDVDYTLTDFGGNASEVVVDPTDPMNMVGQSTRQTWRSYGPVRPSVQQALRIRFLSHHSQQK